MAPDAPAAVTPAPIATHQETTTTTKRSASSSKPLLTSAPPPWHAIATLGVIMSVFAYSLPTWEDIDQVATVDTFTTVLFPDFMNAQALAYIRLLIALSVAFTSFHVAVLTNGWEQITSYMPGSKLLSAPNRLSGLKTMFPFTSLSWNLLGLSFALHAYIAFQGAAGKPVDRWILRTALIVWEIAAPFTLLVAAVVRYAIWPAVLRTTGKTKELKSWRNVMMHNINVLFALAEAALLGGVKVQWSHFAFAPLVGCLYVIFSWAMVMQWNPKNGAQYIYFFMDTTLPGYTSTIAMLMLLAVLTTFYAIFCVGDQFLAVSGQTVWTHATYVAAICSTVMRFGD
uniref:Uncharacterized protein n=1 Tax=Amphora coffeiformis TaxID=265554 RepID=A0A7S3L2B7_9STRA